MDLMPVLIFCPSFDGFNPMPEVISRKDSFNMRLTNSEMWLHRFWVPVDWSTSAAEKRVVRRELTFMFILIKV
jgi:hypothetical protein